MTDLTRLNGQMEPEKNCAYNRTREAFLGLQVVAGDFSLPSLMGWMATLKANSGTGIWMNPFRGLPAREVRVPVDLIYLDENYCVLETVELYPTFRPSTSTAPAASVLVLPAHSISISHTEVGDELLICPSEEIKWRLEQIANPSAAEQATYSPPAPQPLRPILVRDMPPRPASPPLEAQTVVPASAAIDPRPALPANGPSSTERSAPPPSEPRQQPAKPWMSPARMPQLSALARLGRWLLPEPRDPRKVLRKPVEGMVAFFFTGGAPQAYEVRDLSAKGLFVVTTERWYPGTIIRMTLTKPENGQPPAERSITVQTRAVRWGNDGVGLEFLVDAPNSSSASQQMPLGGVNSKQLERFLKGVLNPGR